MSGKHRKVKKQRYIKGAVFGHGRSPKTPPPPMKPIGQVRRVVDTDEGLIIEYSINYEGKQFIHSITPIAMMRQVPKDEEFIQMVKDSREKNDLFWKNFSRPSTNIMEVDPDIIPPKKRWFE